MARLGEWEEGRGKREVGSGKWEVGSGKWEELSTTLLLNGSTISLKTDY